jgi:diaminopimelate epimerase
MRFAKYHALGNDYLVVDPATVEGELSPRQIRLICDRHYGIGSDGVLLGPLPSGDCDFGLRLFNPDGGEFEKSGNGLRIFARYLWDEHHLAKQPFTISTPGGRVTAQVDDSGRRVTVDMGVVSFDSQVIPVAGKPREVIDEQISVAGRTFRFCAATIGNPHCVLLCQDADAELARRYGPAIEHDRRFPNRTNVQFMQVASRSSIRIEIWERGVGYTLASGSSSCAAAAVARRLGLCESHVTVSMPGGELDISIADDWRVTMAGPVTKICIGSIAAECFAETADPAAR